MSKQKQNRLNNLYNLYQRGPLCFVRPLTTVAPLTRKLIPFRAPPFRTSNPPYLPLPLHPPPPADASHRRPNPPPLAAAAHFNAPSPPAAGESHRRPGSLNRRSTLVAADLICSSIPVEGSSELALHSFARKSDIYYLRRLRRESNANWSLLDCSGGRLLFTDGRSLCIYNPSSGPGRGVPKHSLVRSQE